MSKTAESPNPDDEVVSLSPEILAVAGRILEVISGEAFNVSFPALAWAVVALMDNSMKTKNQRDRDEVLGIFRSMADDDFESVDSGEITLVVVQKN